MLWYQCWHIMYMIWYDLLIWYDMKWYAMKWYDMGREWGLCVLGPCSFEHYLYMLCDICRHLCNKTVGDIFPYKKRLYMFPFASSPLKAPWLIRIIVNPSMTKYLHPLQIVGWNYLSIPKRQRLYRWSLGMDEWYMSYFTGHVITYKAVKTFACLWPFRQCS